MSDADKRQLRHWKDTRPHGDDIARLVTLLFAECAELKRLNLALAERVKAQSDLLGKKAEKNQ